MIKGNSEEHFPRILQIAGMYPGITPEELMAPSSPAANDAGFWSYFFPDPDDPNIGVVAVPGSDVVTESIDPVAIVCRSTSIGVKGDDVEGVIVIDRADTDFYSGAFYALRTFENKVEIASADSIDDFDSILGKVIICMMPANKGEIKSTGFLEDE